VSDPIEIRAGFRPKGRVTDVVFDWDGTLSYIRAGWAEVMLELFLGQMPSVAGEDLAARRRLAHDDIWSLNGKPTVFQMQRLAERVAERGGRALAAAEYQNLYAEALGRVIATRLDDVRERRRTPDDYMPPGARALLGALRSRGVRLHVASGTEQRFVEGEAESLGVAGLFAGRIHGPVAPDDRAYSKRGVLDALLLRKGIAASQLGAFGDGHVEIEQAHLVGGTAIAVASDEETFGSGRIDPAKRTRLNAVGADAVIPDYHESPRILELLGHPPD
jgi:phosphoglycolate phosphatase-like HAD superfamily hydrolase